MAKRRHPEGSEPFDVTLPEGFDLGEHQSALEAAAEQAGWTVERDGSVVVVRDVWTENEDHAAWLVATVCAPPIEVSGRFTRSRQARSTKLAQAVPKPRRPSRRAAVRA